jgi:fumarate hydratase class II
MTRQEEDSLGSIDVDVTRLWGAQTQRALQHFPQGSSMLPWAVTEAMLQLKRAAAEANASLGLLPESIAQAISAAAEELLTTKAKAEFPLSIWQSGSGTQSHMNVNEVIANRASELLGGPRGVGRLVHAHDHVNLGQSSNDVFPSAMHLAAVESNHTQLLPCLALLRDEFSEKANAFQDLVKVGRTHFMDATPITLGQEFSGYVALLDRGRERVLQAQEALYELAIGGGAVGTGMTTHPAFSAEVVRLLQQETGRPWRVAANLMQVQSTDEALRAAHGVLAGLAGSLHKIANDIRFLSSGPRAGIGELRLPANEPGSSIMPGKTNPTQCEVLSMVCCRVAGNDVVLQMTSSHAHCELSIYRPLVISCYLESATLLAAACKNFARFCIADLQPNYERISQLLERSLMIVTALSPHLGYDKSADIARYAYERELSIREAALALHVASERQLDEWLEPTRMV